MRKKAQFLMRRRPTAVAARGHATGSGPRHMRRLRYLVALLEPASADAAAPAVGAGSFALVPYDSATLAATSVFSPDAGGDPELPLSDDQISQFLVEGHVVLPGILSADYTAALKADVDAVELDRIAAHESKTPGPDNVAYDAIGKLTSHPPTVRKVQQLMR